MSQPLNPSSSHSETLSSSDAKSDIDRHLLSKINTAAAADPSQDNEATHTVVKLTAWS